MVRLDTVTFEDATSKTHTFDVYHLHRDFIQVRAVYVIARMDAPGDYTMLYVGETGDLSKALETHPQKACFEEHRANRVGVHLDLDEASRKRKAAALIENYNPPCND